MAGFSPQNLTTIIAGVVIVLVLLFRIRAMRRARRLRLETLWIVPALFALAFAVATYEAPPPTTLGWLWLVLAAATGGLFGWQRGKLMRIGIDPVTHALNQRGSPAALLFIVLLLVARRGLAYEAAQLGMNIYKATGLAFAFAFGLMSATRVEMYLRARRLLAEARVAQSPSGISTGPTTSR